jgi:phosphate/sulfate permease
MPRFDPSLVLSACAVFAALGIFNFFVGFKRLRRARSQGVRVAWYRQASILTGIEYLLIVCVMLLNLGMTHAWFPASLTEVVISLYVSALLLAALVLGMIIFFAIRGSRSPQQRQAPQTMVEDQKATSSTQRTAQVQKRRDRRQKNAQARRRRTGRA